MSTLARALCAGMRRDVMTAMVAAAGISLALGAAVARIPHAELLILVMGLLGLLAAAIARFGRLGLPLLLLVVTPLIPVVSGVYGQPRSYAGIDGSTARTFGVAALAAVAALLVYQGAAARRTRLVLVRAVLITMAVVGMASALFTSAGSADFLKLASQSAGQPILYALMFTIFVGVLSRDRGAEEKLLMAWCLATIGEGLIVAAQLGSGAAYDPVRGITRAQGTMGADALGAFAMFGVFGAVSLHRVASRNWTRRLAIVGVVAGMGALFASLSRGSVIALAVGLAILVISRPPKSPHRKRGAGVILLVVLAAMSIYLTHGLWEKRLGASTTAGFDRPATWVGGLRLAEDHPAVGVGAAHLVEVISSSSRYSDTNFGVNGAVPHNSWLFVTAANGVAYGVLLAILAIMLALAVARRTRRADDRYLLAGLTAVGLVFFVNNLFDHPEIMLYVVLAASVLTTAGRTGAHSGSSA
jgi:O-Antigen ligase